MKRPSPARGFTLVELMISVAIVAILASVAYPAYSKYLVKSNRSAAESHMMQLAQAETQYMADSRSYTADKHALGVTEPQAVTSKYNVSITTTDAPPGFTITASPVPGSTQDGDGDLTINEAGVRLPADKW